ncbi:EpsG family protein [Planococcus sp. SE5232]|uniref:EpsG family protein n=1 Tax=unclassified Planococcus (in: firmicutes) TaxID=2662419 RepID=UPI003D6B9660
MFLGVLFTGSVFQIFNKRFLFLTFAAILMVLGFFRYGIGIDYFSYEYLYHGLAFSVMDEIRYGSGTQEIGFRAVGAFLKSLGFTYQQYLMVFVAINIIYIAKLSNKYSKNPTLSLLLFFCFYYITWTFSGIRQGVVIAVGLYYLLKYIEKNKPVKLIVVSILLSTIHASAIVLIVFYFLSKIDFKKNTLIILSLLSLVVSVLPTGIVISKLTWLPFFDRFIVYTDLSYSLNFLDFATIGRIFFLILAFIFYDYYSQQGDMSRKIINLFILSIILYFCLQFSEATAARLAIYGKYLDIIIFANILYLWREPINRLLYVYAILVLCNLYLFKETESQVKPAIQTDSIIAPYVSILNKDDHSFNMTYDFLKGPPL